MRKNTFKVLLVIAGVLLLGYSLVFGYAAPGTGIVGSSHDLSSTGYGTKWGVTDSQDRICIFCHAPHHSVTPEAAAINYYPLWNHDVTSATYRTYQNTDPLAPYIPDSVQHQLNAGIQGQIPGQPGAISKLCLSCHDGTLAISAYGFAPSSSIGSRSGNTAISGVDNRIAIGADLAGGYTGNDLSNHHPVGFDYAEVISAGDDEIRAISSPLIGTSHGLTIQDVLFGGMVECASCHDVHNTKNDGDKFLWVPDTGSRLCLSCHAKGKSDRSHVVL